MQKNKFDVLGLGSVTVDFVGTVDSWPVEGAKKQLQNLSIHDGGLVGTALATVAALGGTAAFAGKLGDSQMAKRAVETLKKKGVDTSFVIKTQNAEPIVSFVITNPKTAQRNIFWTNQSVEYPYPSEFTNQNWLKIIRVLLVDHVSGQAGLEAAKMARQNNIPVVIDVEQDTPCSRRLISIASHVILSEDFAFELTKTNKICDVLKSLRTHKEQTIIITQGDRGCVGLYEGGDFELSAFKVNVVDTTGCGDVFHGAFALSVARGKSVIESARFACAAAALCATKIGGRDGIPTRAELLSLLKE